MIGFRSLVIGFLVSFVFVASATPVCAQSASSTEAEIRRMLEQRDREIKDILGGSGDTFTAEQRARLKELINGVIDFQVMAQTALGPHWSELSAEQQEEFVSVFRDVVRAQSMSDLGVYNSKVRYDQIDVQGDSAFVRTRTTYEGRSTPVDYVLGKRDGEWLAEDIVVDGVSTTEGYARSFQNIIRKHGYEALLKSLKKRRDQAEKKS